LKACFRDRDGGLWFGTTGGLSHLMPRLDEPPEAPPPILISGLQVAGSRKFVSALGETDMLLPDLTAGQNQLQIDFIGLSFAPGGLLNYQYKLEGTDADWSAPTEQRSVAYRLAAGRYKFMVRAVNSDGVVSSNPAVIMFRILPPLWARWWSLTLAAIGLTLILFGLYRYRVARLIELERVRTRIASDLHDDIGANLSLLAGMSEMLDQQVRIREPQMSERLSMMAAVSRRSVEAMSDIVWAVNPNKDHLRDLVQRMRRFASDAFTSRNMAIHFNASDAAQNIKLDAEVRRGVFLVFKEAVNNAARHSHCASAEIELAVERGWLTVQVRDHGCGFDPARADGGEGLVSMRRRASKLGGTLTVISRPGGGSSVLLKAPLR
jgi:signal transduction histidine kinase